MRILVCKDYEAMSKKGSTGYIESDNFKTKYGIRFGYR